MTGYIGDVAIVRERDLPAALNQRVGRFAIRDYRRLDKRYLFYLLRDADIRNEIESLGYGSAQANISPSLILGVEVPLPSLPEQRAIAHILGTLDDKIELNRRMNETLEAMARALFKSWFVDFDPVRAKAEGLETGLPQHIADLFPDSFEDSELGEIPRGWEVKKLADICEKPQYGYTASASDEPLGPRFLRITDINKRDWIEWQDVPYCNIEPAQKKKYALAPGDIVIARMADPGHAALIEEEVDAVFASYLIRFRPHRYEYARYLQYWLRSDSYWNTVRSTQSGTTRANLNAKVLGGFDLVMPSGDILREFGQLVKAVRRRVVASVHESRTLSSLRDTLLPKLISGDLRIKDPERFLTGALQ